MSEERSNGFEAGAVLGLVGRVAGYGALFLFQLTLVRVLGPGPAGRLFPVLALVTLLAVLGRFGLDRVGLREISRYLGAGETDRARGVARWILWRVGITALVVSGVALAVLTATGGRLALEGDPGALTPLILSIPTFAVAFASGELMRGGRRVGQSAILQLIVPYGLTIGGLLWMWGFGFSAAGGPAPTVLGVARLWFLSTLVAASVGVLQVYRMTGGEGCVHPDAPQVAEMRSSAPAILWTSLVVMALGQLDVLILGFLTEGESISRYVAASRLAMVASLALVGVNAILAPLFVGESGRARSGEPGPLQAVAERGARWSGGLAALVASVVALGGPLFLTLFDPGFSDAHAVLLILLAGQVVNAATGGVLLMLQMTGFERVAARILSVVAVLLVPSYVVATGLAGIAGAGAVTAAGMAGGNLAMVAAGRRAVGVRTISDRWPGTLAMFFFAALAGWISWTLWPSAAPWTAAAGSVMALGAVWFWLFEVEDREWFLQLGRGLRARTPTSPNRVIGS